MNIDIAQIIHYIITGILAAFTVYHKFVKDKDKKDKICQEEFQQVKTDVAILKERSHNTNAMLTLVNAKLDEIDKELRND